MVVDAPIHAPFQQCKSLAGGQRFEGDFAIELKNTLRTNPTTYALGAVNGYMKVCESVRRYRGKVVVQNSQPIPDCFKRAVNRKNKWPGFYPQAINSKPTSQFREREVGNLQWDFFSIDRLNTAMITTLRSCQV